MKECKFCGMPLDKNSDEEICDYCKNDDLRVAINSNNKDEDLFDED